MKKNFFYNFLLTGSALLFPLITFPYVSRILGADGLGVVNFIISYSENYIIIAALGIPIYGIREIAKTGNDIKARSKLFFEILSIHIIFTSFLLLIYSVSIYTNEVLSQYKTLGYLGGISILFNIFSIQWFFSGVDDFKYITIRSLIIRVLSILSIFIFVKEKNDFVIYLAIYVSTITLTAFIDMYAARKYITPNIKLSVKGVISHSRSVLTLGVYTVLTSIYTVLPVTLLGFLSTKAAVGYYYGANRVIRMVISLFSALITVMIPRLNLAVERRQTEEYLSLIHKGIKVIVSFGVPITFFVFLTARPIMMILGGKDFVSSIFVIQVMSPVILIVSFAQIFVYLILSANRKDKQMVILSIVGMILSFMINLSFIPHFAEKATGFSQLISELVVTFLAFYFCKQVLSISFPTREFLVNIAYATPFIFIVYIANQLFNSDFFILIFAGVVCGLYYLLYQLFLIRDTFFVNIVKPYFRMFLRNEKPN